MRRTLSDTIIFVATIVVPMRVTWANVDQTDASDRQGSVANESTRILRKDEQNNGVNIKGSNGNSNRNQGNTLQELVDKQTKWRARDNLKLPGLKVEVLDNLQNDQWRWPMQQAVQEWNHSRAVTLNEKVIKEHDPECKPELWFTKICNKDHGNSGWKGASQTYLYEEEIVAGTVWLNDWHVNKMSSAEKQYALCHEFGHALGLKHRDEDFDNEDKNDCMDYTLKHENNMYPGWLNFIILEEIYGRVDDNRGRSLRAENAGFAIETKAEMSDNDEMFQAFKQWDLNASFESLSSFGTSDDWEGWKSLSKTNQGEVHERELGNGFAVRTSFLLN